MNDNPPDGFPRSLLNVGWRYLVRHYWQSILMVVGITLGVAVVVGVDMANESASRAFDLSAQAVTGRATHYISAGSQGLDEGIYIEMRRSGLDLPSTPIISDYVTSPQLGEITLQLLGVDPFTEGPFRDYLVEQDRIPVAELTRFLTEPGGVLVSQDLAERYDLEIESPIEIEYAGEITEGRIVGTLKPDDPLSRSAVSGVLLMDIATAQEVTGRIGRLDRVDLISPVESERILQDLQTRLPLGAQILPVEARQGVIQDMTSAFRINLMAMSLLALIVALFLIYNTMTFSVVQRRPLFGTLRCLGVTRREVFLMVLGEALLIGTLGSVLGILLGILMGRGMVALVTQTINDLFFVVTVRDIPIPVPSLIKGGLLGILATAITSAFPAWEAASVPPRTALSRSGLEAKARRVVRWIGVAGMLLILVGVGVLAIPTRNLVVSFSGTFIITFGIAMLTPTVTTWLMRYASRLTSWLWGILGHMAPREVINSISRTSVAVAALMVAVAVTIGVNLMVGSFRYTVETWMSQILHGDIYVSVPGATVSQPTYSLDPGVIEILENWPGVARVDLLQTAVVDSPSGPIQVSANNNPNDGLEQLYLAADHPPQEIWSVIQEGAILVSEPLANRLALPRHGGELALYTDLGLETFPIAGIYYDYASSQGSAIFALENYRQFWEDEQVSAAALVLEPGADVETVTAGLQERLGEVQNLLVRPNQILRADTLEVFERTFTITGALQLMTTFVAFVGILSAMMSLQLDKQRQLGILKAIGLTGRQLWGLVTLETGLMGAVAGLYAFPTGYFLALVLIYIINRRSFGWTLQMQLTPEPFVQALIIAVGAALLAGLYPAWRIVQRNTADAIRFD